MAVSLKLKISVTAELISLYSSENIAIDSVVVIKAISWGRGDTPKPKQPSPKIFLFC